MPADVSSIRNSSISNAIGPVRGHACTVCRKRKLKCDGDRPKCKQCIRGNRVADCVYDETRQTNTQILHERIRQLERVVQTYEKTLAQAQEAPAQSHHVLQHDAAVQPPIITPANTSPARSIGQGPQLSPNAALTNTHSLHPHNPLPRGSDSSIASDYSSGSDLPGSRRGVYTNRNSSGGASSFTISSDTSSGGELSNHMQGVFLSPGRVNFPLSASPAPIESRNLPSPEESLLFSSTEQEWDTEELPNGIDQRTMLTVFMGHRHQAHFEFNVDKFLRSMSLPRDSLDRPHPCLINAIYLFASHFSRAALLLPHDRTFLARARAGINAAVRAQDRLLNAIQASSLVSFYLYFKGRVLEGYWMGGATARLAMACGLHQIKTTLPDKDRNSPRGPPLVDQKPAGMALAEPRNIEELGERIHTFWQVWCVDKYGVMSTGFAPSLEDDDLPMMKIKTCWPPRMRDFSEGIVSDSDMSSFQSLFEDVPPRRTPESVTALSYKGMELLTRASKLRKFGLAHPDFETHFNQIDDAIIRLEKSLPLLSYSEDGDLPVTESMPIHTRMILPHAVMLAARINLHVIRAAQSEQSHHVCLEAANEAMEVLHAIKHYDFNYLEVALAVCWKHVSEVFMRHVQRLRSSSAPDLTTIQRYQHEADTSTLAMKRICHLYAATVIGSWKSM